MAKKKIGCTEVKNGVARGWFVIPERLKRGVYELLGEYQGNEVYQPSYDLKYLIVGLGTEFQGIQATYSVDEYTRELTVTGRLVGYDEMNEEVGLANEDIKFKIGSIDNPLNLSDEERSIDATTLTTVHGATSVKTGANGFFTFQCYVPEKYKDWEYQLFIRFDGNYEYVSCIATSVLRIGYAPTYTVIEVFPSTHLHPQGGMILRASVYLEKDVDDFGNPKSGAERVKYGSILFKTSSTGENNTWTNIKDSGYGDSHVMQAQKMNENDGWVIHRYMFNKDIDDSFDMYVYANYYGSATGIGYKPSKSRIVHITVDQYGVKLDPICMQLETLDVELKTVFYLHGQNPDKELRLNYCDGTKPVPIGYVKVTGKEA